LEKTRKEKYQEFLEDATKRYTELNVALANQKKVVKQLEENARQQELAKKEQDDASIHFISFCSPNFTFKIENKASGLPCGLKSIPQQNLRNVPTSFLFL